MDRREIDPVQLTPQTKFRLDNWLISFRSMDMVMLSLFNAREREEAEWRSLFKQADKRFTDLQIWAPSGASMAIIEARWGY